MGEQTFAHSQVIVNAIAGSPVLRPRTSKAKCNHYDDDDSPNQDEAAPTCDEDVVEQDAYKSEEASARQCKLILDATVVEQEPSRAPIA